MDQPLGFICKKFPQRKCKIRRSNYGLKQSARNWNGTFHAEIQKFGLSPSSTDPCVYTGKYKEVLVILAIFVDDGIICCTEQEHIDTILTHMGKVFSLTHDEPEIYVGLHITRDRPNRTMHIDQSRYIQKMLQ